MNAYELADKLKSCIDDGSTDLVCVCGAVNMLRQQADRITELEKQLKIKESIYAAEPYLSDWAKKVKKQYALQIKELSVKARLKKARLKKASEK
jgi:hypothetical protein